LGWKSLMVRLRENDRAYPALNAAHEFKGIPVFLEASGAR